MGKSLVCGAVLVAGILLSATQALAATTVGTASSTGSNCDPFSCAGRYGYTEYQQDYAATAFSGMTSFNEISFYAASGYAGDKMDPATYAVSFYLTPSATASSNLGSNEQTLLGTFGAFTLGGTLPSTLTLTGSTINYDPSQGNLLMDVVITNASNGGNPLGYFAGDQQLGSNPIITNATAGPSGVLTHAGGLVTTFAAVPEPTTWSMMIIGASLIGLALRRRNQAMPFAA
jgi:hypothetical protein